MRTPAYMARIQRLRSVLTYSTQLTFETEDDPGASTPRPTKVLNCMNFGDPAEPHECARRKALARAAGILKRILNFFSGN